MKLLYGLDAHQARRHLATPLGAEEVQLQAMGVISIMPRQSDILSIPPPLPSEHRLTLKP